MYFISRLEPFGAEGLSLFNLTALVDATFIAALLVIGKRTPEKNIALAYVFAAHLVILGLIYREFVELENGQGYVSAIWGTYSIALLVAGFRAKNNMLRKVGMATLLSVIAKLFVVDLANLETIWRILLFIGLGGILLLVSYYLQSLWAGKDSHQAATPDNPGASSSE